MAESIFSNLGAFLLAIFMTIFPNAGFLAPVMTTSEESCLLNITIMSDIHLESPGFFRDGMLKQGLRRINNAKDKVDGIVFPGDITNYGDEETLKKFYSIISEYTDIPCVVTSGNHDIGHVGDRDVTNITRDEARANIIKYKNQYYGTNDTTNYYTYMLNGYKFIVFGDEVNNDTVTDGKWDEITMTTEELEFLKKELAADAKSGKPTFVVSHWPIDGTTSEDTIWDGSSIPEEKYPVKSILEEYGSQVVYISGHMHSGVKSTAFSNEYNITSIEKVNGVTYVNLPSYGLVNTFGLTLSGRGAQLEVYEDKIVYRPMNYLTGYWYKNSQVTIDIRKPA